MGWGNITLTDKEFYTQMARFADVSNLSTVEKYWEAAVETIIRELYINHTCRVPMLGTFFVKEIGESIQLQKGKDGEEKLYKVPARIVPQFVPHDDFTNDVNMIAVTKLGRRRVRRGSLTERDYKRQIRAESMGVIGSLSEERMEASREKFKEMLKDKKNKVKGKVDKNNDEDE